MKIQQLTPDVIKKLRSDVAFTSIAHCVEELVWNAIDADANCIAVRLNLPFYRIQVVDNGNGIPSDQMKLLGTRYATSKCHSLEDLENLKYGGFRGEALSSLKEISSVLMIESRSAASNETYCKIFMKGIASKPKRSKNSRPSKGTTVTVLDFMYNMPVRRSTISEALDLEDTRKLLRSIALVQPGISFSLQNEATQEICFQFKKCSSLLNAFIQLFDKSKSRNLKHIQERFDEYEIQGYLSTDSYFSKDLQFLYVNQRLVLKTKIHKLINNTLKKALFTKQLSKLDTLDSSSPSRNNPVKNQVQYGIFVLNILCPYSKYDAIFDRRRTEIEFRDSDKIFKLVEGALLNFLKKEKMICISEEENEIQPSNVTLNSNEIIDTYNYRNGLFSHAAKRLNIVSVPLETFRKFPTKEDSNPDKNISLHPAKNNEHVKTASHFVYELDKTSSVPADITNSEITVSDADQPKKVQNVTKGSQNIEQSRANQNFITLKESTANGSIFDNLRLKSKNISTSDINDVKPVINSPESSLNDTLDIPCRAVFPTRSPIMLRVPAKSTLSLLQKRCPQSHALLKLKEKYKFLPYKNKNKCSMQNHRSDVQSKINNNISDDNENNCKMIHENKGMPVSINFKNISCQNSTYKLSGKDVQETKPSQHPSVPIECQKKILSKYAFRNEPKPLALQKLSYSSKINRKHFTQNLHLDKDSDNSNYESDASKKKKMKPSVLENFPHQKTFADSIANEVIKNTDFVHFKLFESSSISEISNEDSASLKHYSHKIDHPNANSIVKSQNSKIISNLISDQYNSFSLQTFSATDKLPRFNNSQTNNKLDASHSNNFSGHVFFSELSKDNINEYSLERQTVCELISSQDCFSDFRMVESELQVSTQQTKNIDAEIEIKTKLFGSSHEMSVNKYNAENLIKTYDGKLSYSPETRDNICDSNCTFSEGHQPYNKEYISPILESRNPISREESECDSELSPIIPLQNKDMVNQAFNTNIKNKEFTSMVQCSDLHEIPAISVEADFDCNSHSILQSKKEFMPVLQKALGDNQLSYPNQSVLDDIGNEKLLVKDKSSSAYLKNEFEYGKLNCQLSDISSNKCMPSDDIYQNIQTFHSTDYPLINRNLELESVHCPNKPTDYLLKSGVDEREKESQIEQNEIITRIPCADKGDINLNLGKCYEYLKSGEEHDGESSVNISNLPEQNNSIYVSSKNKRNEVAQCSNFINYNTNVECSLSTEVKSSQMNSVNTLTLKAFKNESSQTVTDTQIYPIDEKILGNKLINNVEIPSRWICQMDPETKRVTYIDTCTGNSSFFMPEQGTINETESTSGHFKKTHFFLSHNFSPFITEEASLDITDCTSTSGLQTELTNFVANKEEQEWNCKWRTTKQESSYCDSNVEEMFNKWENPIFNISSEVNCIEDPRISQHVPHMYGILNSYRFSKNTLRSLQVIGQVDCKFIACILQDFNEGCKDQKLLALFDQHAVHERIRLEELTDDLYETVGNGERRIKSVPITPSLQIALELEEIRLLHAYQMYLQQIGIQLTMNDDSNVVDVYSIPAAFVEKETKELRKKLPEVLILVEKLIREWLTSLIQTRSVSYIMPKTLSAILNSQACRGAVKFGDPLDLSQCEHLLNSLLNCKLPFQCAHGRPSIAPILDIKKIDALCKKRSPPKLQNLSSKILK